MKLFLLEAVTEHPCFMPWYDKAFAMVVRAENETQARLVASAEGGAEAPEAWLNPASSSCREIPLDGPAEAICVDVAEA